jgi:Ca2+-binding RTX toxin-like protein
VNLTGTTNADDLIGTRFNDTLAGGASADTLSGRGGIDRFVLGDAASADVITDFTSGTDKLVIQQSGIPIGNGNTTVEGALVRSAPGGFSTAAELVIFSKNITSSTITTAHAAAAIGQASGTYAMGSTRLFAVDNGVRCHLYRFRAADANPLVAASELTLLADLRATPALALTDVQFAL